MHTPSMSGFFCFGHCIRTYTLGSDIVPTVLEAASPPPLQMYCRRCEARPRGTGKSHYSHSSVSWHFPCHPAMPARMLAHYPARALRVDIAHTTPHTARMAQATRRPASPMPACQRMLTNAPRQRASAAPPTPSRSHAHFTRAHASVCAPLCFA